VSALLVSDLHKRFGQQAVLTGLHLDVPAGSLTAILGASGSGKTTLLRLLAGFEAPDRGTLRIGERVVAGNGTHVHPEDRGIGYVPQDGGLFPHLTVEANIGFGIPRKARRQGVGDLLELVGLSDLAGRYPHQLSGGQQQRVALARALAVGPEVVLLDEPFSSLDAHHRESVREEVGRILRETSTTALLVTHDQDEALSFADRVAVLRDGKIVQCAAPQDLYTRPVDDAVARFVGDANLLEGMLEGDVVDTLLGQLPARWHGGPLPTPCDVAVLIRPEQIAIRAADGGGAGVAAQIIRSAYHGHDAVTHVQVGNELGGQELITRSLGEEPLPAGTRVMLSARGPVLVWPAALRNDG
jgi:iron(III) transport system ATP-binding protein